MTEWMRQQFGNYRVIRPIGVGGFAQVYLCEHIHLDTEAAVKVLRTQLTDEDVEKFRSEARTIARLKHPHIVRVFDFGVENSIAYLVMDYAPNGTLRQRHPEGTPLPPTTVLPYVKQVASALQYAHEQKFIHRDIKPQNMLLGPNNEVWLSDFGIAEIAQSTISQVTQDQAGSPAYMAPEQFLGKPRPASDQYSFGVIIYEWLCGSRPFKGTLTELYSQHMFVAPPPLHEKVPAITQAVEAVVMRALAKDPHERFASVQAFADALEEAYGLEPYILPASNFDLPPLFSTGSPPGEPPSAISPAPALESFDSSGPTALAPAPLPPPAPPQKAREANMQPGPTALAPAPLPPAAQAASAPPASSTDTPPGAIPHTPAPNALPAPAQPQPWLKRKLSRRAVIVGLIGTAVVVGGATAAFVWEQASKGPSGAQNPTPTPLPLGTTILTYSHHTNAVKGVAWSPDGKRIVSASLDRTVQVWDATTGSHILKYTGHTNQVKTVAWSPDGKLIASGSLDGTVQVWDATTGSHIYTYTGHAPQAVRSVTWSSNSTRIASGAEDKTVQVWDATTGNLILTYHGHAGTVFSIAWSPDGTRIASGSDDLTVQVWDATTGNQLFIYRGHTMRVETVAWSPDSTRIASGGYEKTVQVWDAATGGKTFFLLYSGHKDVVEAVAWSPDGTRLASGSGGNHIDNTVQVWDAANGHLFFTYTAHSSVVWTVAWSPDGMLIASGSGSGGPQYIDNTVRVWQAK